MIGLRLTGSTRRWRTRTAPGSASPAAGSRERAATILLLAAGESFGEVESTKSVSDLYAPLSASVVAVNAELEAKPQLVNSDPYGQGWLLELRASGDTLDDGLAGLLEADAYRDTLG